MKKAAGVLAFAVALLLVGISEAPAVPFDSPAGIGTCTAGGGGGGGACAGGFVAITPDPSWQPNNSGASAGAFWVSFANTGSGGSVVTPNVTPPLTHSNATETFTVHIAAGFTSLSLLVWADDTAGVSLNGGATYLASDTAGASAPNPVQGSHCADGGLTCTPGGGAHFTIPLGGLAADLSFDVFQRGGGTFGLLYAGDLTPVPEPATMLLVGSVLAAAGFVSRKRFHKDPQSS